MQGLTPGRVVHYVERDVTEDALHFAAIVSRVIEPETDAHVVDLVVFDARGAAPRIRVPFSAAPDQIGTWHWIEPA